MKNSRTTILCGLLIISAIFSFFTSCRQDVIFYDIAQEIEYEAPIVEGNIFSMVPCGGQLFVQDNLIYQKAWTAKKNSSGKWVRKSVPVSGKPVIRLASDEHYLYALVFNTPDAETGSVYAAEVTSGTLGAWPSTPVAENVIELFDNRVYDSNGFTAGRNAYFTDENKVVKKLAGTGNPAAVSATDEIGDSSSYIKTAGHGYKNGTGTDFFSSNAAFSVIVTSGTTTYLYTFDRALSSSAGGKTLKYKASEATSWLTGGTTNSTITVLTANGNDELLIGTQAGYETSAIASDGKPANGVTPSGSNDNAESAFGTRYITGIWHYGDTGTLYAAVVGLEHSSYNKLWGYYSGGKWNYE